MEHKGEGESRKGAERAKGPRPVEAERADAGQKSEDPCGAGRAAAGQNACAAAGQRACTAAGPAGVWRPRSPTSMGRPMGPASMGRPMGGASMGRPNKQAPCGNGPRPPHRAHGWPAAGPVRKRPEAAPQSARAACRWAGGKTGSAPLRPAPGTELGRPRAPRRAYPTAPPACLRRTHFIPAHRAHRARRARRAAPRAAGGSARGAHGGAPASPGLVHMPTGRRAS